MKKWDAQALLSVMQPAWPVALPESTASLLLQRGRVACFKTGDVISRQGNAAKSLHVLLSGQAHVVMLRPSGKEFVITILGPGDGYSFLHIYHPIPHISSLVARENCEVLILSKHSWLQTADECPELKDAVISILSHRLRSALDMLEFSNMTTGLACVAHRLLAYVRHAAPIESPDPIAAPHFEVPLTQATLASMLSLSRQRTNALLHQLEDEGAITLQYGKILVLDLAILRKIIVQNEPE